jgi:uncharacterized membrane protein
LSEAAVLAVLCGLAATISWGLADFWAARAARTVGPVTAVVAGSAIGFLGFTLFYVGSGQRIVIGSDLGYAAGAGVALGAGLMIFYRALKLGPVSLVSPLSSAYPLVTTLLVVLVFRGSLSLRQFIGIGVVTLGVMAASELFSVRASERRLSRGPLLALCAAGAWGVCWTFMY